MAARPKKQPVASQPCADTGPLHVNPSMWQTRSTKRHSHCYDSALVVATRPRCLCVAATRQLNRFLMIKRSISAPWLGYYTCLATRSAPFDGPSPWVSNPGHGLPNSSQPTSLIVSMNSQTYNSVSPAFKHTNSRVQNNHKHSGIRSNPNHYCTQEEATPTAAFVNAYFVSCSLFVEKVGLGLPPHT
eukprot:2390219-Amphidinium_carterae.1